MPFSSDFSGTAIRLHMTIYLFTSIILTIKNKFNRRDYFSEIEKVKFNWIFIFLLALLLHFLVTIPLAQYNEFKYSLIIALIPCVILNVVFFKAITDPSVFESIEFDKKENPKFTKSVVINMQNLDVISTFMNEQKPYLHKDITITQLSNEIGISRQELSAIIKNYYKMNFFEFINSFRIEEAKTRLSLSNAAMTKIDAIADETGFNSRASFYEVFKKYTGTTPANYRGKIAEPV
jgi:AraC-like DNA-binding protein